MGLTYDSISAKHEGHPAGEKTHTPAAISAAFNDPNLIVSADLVPLVAFIETAGLRHPALGMATNYTCVVLPEQYWG